METISYEIPKNAEDVAIFKIIDSDIKVTQKYNAGKMYFNYDYPFKTPSLIAFIFCKVQTEDGKYVYQQDHISVNVDEKRKDFDVKIYTDQMIDMFKKDKKMYFNGSCYMIDIIL